MIKKGKTLEHNHWCPANWGAECACKDADEPPQRIDGAGIVCAMIYSLPFWAVFFGLIYWKFFARFFR